jgi:hypothetical protein
MSKLHELKIKYEQSQLAERAAWGVWQVQCIKGVTSPSGEPLRGYRDASAAWRETNRTFMEDRLAYLDEIASFDRYWCVVGRLSMWVSATCMVYLIVWSMT